MSLRVRRRERRTEPSNRRKAQPQGASCGGRRGAACSETRETERELSQLVTGKEQLCRKGRFEKTHGFEQTHAQIVPQLRPTPDAIAPETDPS